MHWSAMSNATCRTRPVDFGLVPTELRAQLGEYCALLEESNGIVFDNGTIRLFGIGTAGLVQDSLAWNQSEWRAYFKVPSSVFFWGENVFGDQYGTDLIDSRMVTLLPESGMFEIESRVGIVEYIERRFRALSQGEHGLVAAARARNLTPSAREHISFVQPLSVGGRAEISNLELMDSAAHLHFLGQLHEQISHLPAGTKISRFVEEKS
jgi:hypothetical protein